MENGKKKKNNKWIIGITVLCIVYAVMLAWVICSRDSFNQIQIQHTEWLTEKSVEEIE